MKILNISLSLIFFSLLTFSSVITAQNTCESASGFLTSLPPQPPTLCSPLNQATDLANPVTLTWYSQIHVGNYMLEVSTSPDFDMLLFDETGLMDTLFTGSMFEALNNYYWRVRAGNMAGVGQFSEQWSFTTSSSSAIDRNETSIPKRFALLPLYPNPFNPITKLTYLLPKKSKVSITIYNSMGQSIQELVSAEQEAGEYVLYWNGCDHSGKSVATGIYICQLIAGGQFFHQKVLLVR